MTEAADDGVGIEEPETDSSMEASSTGDRSLLKPDEIAMPRPYEADTQTEERVRQLEDDLELLNRRYSELKRCLRIIDCDRYCDADGLGIQVIFMNTDVGRRHRHKVEEFLANIMQAERAASKEALPKASVRSTAPCLIRTDESEHEPPSDVAKKACTAIGCTQFHKDFVVDRLGWPVTSYDVPPCHTPGWPTIPYYQQVYSAYLPVDDDGSAPDPNACAAPSRMACFNCEGPHSMSECTFPRDEAKIRKNRQETQKTRLTYKRYHVAEAKYGRMMPGQLSEQLCRALGLPTDGSRLPAHVYRMRTLGYPPGWLLEAELCGSGLSMFDKHGREVNLDGDLMEDGQCPDYRLPQQRPSFDSSKIIDYPGFNAKPSNTFDDYRSHGAPPLAWERTRTELLSQLAADDSGCSSSGAKRPGDVIEQLPKRPRQSTVPKKDDVHDMELADGSDGSDAELIAGGESPALDECSAAALERRRLELLQQLSSEVGGIAGDTGGSGSSREGTEDDDNVTAGEDGSSSSAPPAADEPAVEGEEGADVGGSGPADVQQLDGSTAELLEQSTATQCTPQQQQRSQSIGVQHGTPVPSISEFTKLPSYENFRNGIEDHIPYENLPDAVGTYQRMSVVLQRVREVAPKRDSKKNK